MFPVIHAHTASAVSTLGFRQAPVLCLQFLTGHSMEVLLEHGLRLHGFEFGLEIGDCMAMGATIGTTTGVGELVAIVLALFAGGAPST